MIIRHVTFLGTELVTLGQMGDPPMDTDVVRQAIIERLLQLIPTTRQPHSDWMMDVFTKMKCFGVVQTPNNHPSALNVTPTHEDFTLMDGTVVNELDLESLLLKVTVLNPSKIAVKRMQLEKELGAVESRRAEIMTLLQWLR